MDFWTFIGTLTAAIIITYQYAKSRFEVSENYINDLHEKKNDFEKKYEHYRDEFYNQTQKIDELKKRNAELLEKKEHITRLGTLREVINNFGETAKLIPPSNLDINNTNSVLKFKIEHNSNHLTIYCSDKVSNVIRSNELSMNQVLSLPVLSIKLNDGLLTGVEIPLIIHNIIDSFSSLKELLAFG